ncbi:hypothetical protein FNV43_RR08843 [Rhamnella rubrinervis]|uniref:Uncharacterized protein n=1 Tax=Rhamnella rubrinervis TaxID=2594499 RepID=A0A8K0MJF6_9ROSA|nr:hypothetical protein FNV43_RR08843 [Rhamnella rubrinervis]
MLSPNQCSSIEEEMEHMVNVPYSNAIGSIVYAMICMRPDLAYSNSVLKVKCIATIKVGKEAMRLKGLVIKFNDSAGSEVADSLAFVGLPMTDDDFIMQLINGLPLEFDAMIATINSCSSIAIEEFQSLFMN